MQKHKTTLLSTLLLAGLVLLPTNLLGDETTTAPKTLDKSMPSTEDNSAIDVQTEEKEADIWDKSKKKLDEAKTKLDETKSKLDDAKSKVDEAKTKVQKWYDEQ